MFADTMATYPVQKDVEWFSIPVVSTVVKEYDRTFGIEIIDKGKEGDVISKMFDITSVVLILLSVSFVKSSAGRLTLKRSSR